MKIDTEQGTVTFDRLRLADRNFGDKDPITVHAAAAKAVNENAKGVLAKRSLEEIHNSAKTSATKLKAILVS